MLTVKFLANCLEDRNEKYRQLSGAQYRVQICEVYESEKIRLQSTLILVPPAGAANNETNEGH